MSDYISNKSSINEFKNNDNWIILNNLEISIRKKINKVGTPLKDWDISINYGVKTGYNDAFIIDEATKNLLISQDPKSAELIRPILRGRDIKKFRYNFANQWMITIPCGFTNTNKLFNENGETWFSNKFSNIYNYLKNTEDELSKNRGKKAKGLYKRDDQGDYWWELRSCKYMDEFNKQKIIYPCIMSQEPCFMIDTHAKFYTVAPGNIITGDNLYYLLGCLISKIYYFALRKYYMGGGIEGELKTNRLLILPVIRKENSKNAKDIENIIAKLVSEYEEKNTFDSSYITSLDQYIAEDLNLTKVELDYINSISFKNGK